jgi:hypothetical protein
VLNFSTSSSSCNFDVLAQFELQISRYFHTFRGIEPLLRFRSPPVVIRRRETMVSSENALPRSKGKVLLTGKRLSNEEMIL